jgi:integrase
MGRRVVDGGVRAAGDRIEVRFSWQGRELRPTLDLKPTAANLKHARRLREDVLQDIKEGRLDLLRYFPDYRFVTRFQEGPKPVTFDEVRDAFLKWVRTRQAHSSVLSLQRKLTSFWSPRFGTTNVRAISYKQLSDHVADRIWGSSKTHNNYVSALREMMQYALDHEYLSANPAEKLRMLKVQRPEPNPYTVAEAEVLIAQAHKTHGEIDGLYWHLSFLLGMRPGELISAKWQDWNKVTGKLTVQRMRTEGADKASTKTSVVRHLDLPPAAVPLLNRLRALTALRGDFLFLDFQTGQQIQCSTDMQNRWVALHKIAGVSYREPYQCRHSSVSWKLMAGQNWMKVAQFHGHSLATMLKTYAHWVESDSDDSEVERIRAFHGYRSSTGVATGTFSANA